MRPSLYESPYVGEHTRKCLKVNQRPLGYEGIAGAEGTQGGARLRKQGAELGGSRIGAAWGALVPDRGENAESAHAPVSCRAA